MKIVIGNDKEYTLNSFSYQYNRRDAELNGIKNFSYFLRFALPENSENLSFQDYINNIKTDLENNNNFSIYYQDNKNIDFTYETIDFIGVDFGDSFYDIRVNLI